MTDTQQRIYEGKCSIVLAPFAGLIYVIINPRLNWLKGSLDFVGHFIRHKIAKPDASIEMIAASFEPRYWRTSREYWHMFWNNLVLLSGWSLMCSGFGAVRFFSLYLTSASLAAGVGVILFTVQHNFEHSYASEGRNWNYDKGAIEGTSFLVLPRWLNWFTANIAYHHIHHISAKIPNYRLVGCHKENEDLFAGVRRVRLSEIPGALRYILWDRKMRRIISVAEYQQMIAQTGLAR
jgi:omega-6 fatty acid desaturase (delta-12 desaturase)